MSDASQGEGWWKAADGKWYPPEDFTPPAGWWKASDGNWYPPRQSQPQPSSGLQPTTGPSADATPRAESRTWSTKQLVVIAVAATLVGGALGAALVAPSSDDSGSVAVATTDDESDDDAEPDVPDTTGQSSTTATTPAPADPSTSSALAVVGTVTIPEGRPGELDVVLLGTLDDASGTVPVVVRNNTSSPAYNLEATGTARAPDGSLAGSGSSQGFEPATVEPGEWAFGYVFFSAAIPGDAEFDITATADTEQGFAGSLGASLSEVTTNSDEFGQHVVGIVTNDSDAEMGGPVSVSVACFDQTGTQVLDVHTGFAEGDAIPAGGTSSFTVDLFDAPCPVFAVGASGYTF